MAVDFVLRRPAGLYQKLLAALKRVVFRRVDHFVHYFRNVEGLDRVYGIGATRSEFIPFKANLWRLRVERADPSGDYVLCFGRSLRDYDSFFEAIESSGLPGAITDPHVSGIWNHQSRFTRDVSALPKNVRVLADDISDESQARLLKGARLVVVPIVSSSLVASGIGTILNAMALGKCVIATAGPGVSDLFSDELLITPPEDPRELAATIVRAWHDEELRRATADQGLRYAATCGSEQDLFQRVLDAAARRFGPTVVVSGIAGAAST